MCKRNEDVNFFVRQKSFSNCFRLKFRVEVCDEKCSREVFLWRFKFLSFAFHAKPVLASSTITV